MWGGGCCLACAFYNVSGVLARGLSEVGGGEGACFVALAGFHGVNPRAVAAVSHHRAPLSEPGRGAHSRSPALVRADSSSTVAREHQDDEAA